MKKNIFAILAILAIYLLLLPLLQPFKCSFPLNDDWVYSYSVQHYFETGTMKINDWNAATTVFQIWWGILFSKILGFSLGTLKISTLFLSFAGTFFALMILKRLNYRHVFIPVLFLLFNPVYFVLSFSFMTDVPYFALFLASVYFYLKGLQEENTACLVAGSLFAGFAYLTRQLGILIPFTVIMYLALYDRKKITIKTLCAVVLLPCVVFCAYWYWFNYIHGQTWVARAGLVSALAPGKFYFRLISAAFYFGLFALPFGFIKLRKSKAAKNSKQWGWNHVALFILTILFFIHMLIYKTLPFFDNIISKTGIGTLTVSGSAWKDAGFLSNDVFWVLLTMISGVSFLLMLSKVLKSSFSRHEIFVILCCAAQLVVSLARFKFFDRYLLVMLPIVLIFTAKHSDFEGFFRMSAVSLFLVCFAACSFLGTKDYLSWNAAKWQLGGELTGSYGYKKNEIANGFDWDGYYTFQDNIEQLLKTKKPEAIGDWEWQSLNPYKVIVSYVPDYPREKFVAETEYYDWLVFRKRKIYSWKLL
ncbi:MAG: hypothetical protein A2297_04650 [Elusimicrobia bacterium RIFOXYB2_FULL_48_7]|nr:MAG: hypothetical protein A2297_04650 [Elusimicrobia bacterium RIFOXYB2_FULL_48_7]